MISSPANRLARPGRDAYVQRSPTASERTATARTQALSFPVQGSRTQTASLPPRGAGPAALLGNGGAVDIAGIASAESPFPQAEASTAAPSARADGDLVGELHAELSSRMPPRFFHLDPSTLVLDTVPSSEDRQKRLIRLTIESADRLAIMTSFSVNPAKDHVPGQVSGTTFAMLESLAKRQHDADFTFILLYNDNKLQRNALVAAVVGQNVTANMSLKTESRLPGTTTWPEVVRAYNRQQTDEHLRLGNVRCRIYFVSAKARGAAGSHHNKFAINDRGIAATLGASIANKTKDGWLDGGCIAIGSGLARSQRDYFVDELIGNHAISCGRLLCNGDEAAMQPLARPADTFKALKQVQIRSPFGSDSRVADQERMLDAFDNTGIAFRGGKHKVLWMQNPSNGYRNMFSTGGRIEGKPIGFALAKIFGSAGSGDRLDIAGKKLGTEAFALIGKALARGCDVNILVDVSSRKIADLAATQLYRRTTNPPVGTLTIKHYAPEPQWAQTLRINMDSELVLHAKNYLLTRADGTCVVMTGSYNLDGQSHYRSNENLMVFETRDDRLCRALFEDIRQGSNSKESIYRKR